MKEGKVYLDENGRRLVLICECASYGGGSGPLIAREGEEVQVATQRSFSYRRGVCVAVADDHIRFQIDGEIETIPLSDITRYDQHHLPPKLRSRQ